MTSLQIVILLGVFTVVNCYTWGGALKQTLDANGESEYYCYTGEEYLNVGDRVRTSQCSDCSCSYRYGLSCASVGSANQASARIAGCELVSLPNCCYKFISTNNPEIECVPITCPPDI